MRKNRNPIVDDADVQQFVDALTVPQLRQASGADAVYDLAVFAQEAAGRSKPYAHEFARRVRERVKWMKASN